MKREGAVKHEHEHEHEDLAGESAQAAPKASAVRSVSAEQKPGEVETGRAGAGSGELTSTPASGLARTGTPFDEMERMFSEMDRMFDMMTGQRWMRPWKWEWPGLRLMQPALEEARIPKIDVIDRDEEILLRVEMPGIDSKDLQIDVSEKAVTLSASRAREHKEERGDYFRCEIGRANFARTVGLPTEIIVDDAKARLEKGVLEVHLPKVRKSRRRSIKIE